MSAPVSDEVLYSEFHTLRWLVWGLSALSALLIVVAMLRRYPLKGGLVLGAIVLFLASQHLAAIHRWNQIVLTRSSLRVGKERFRQADFDFTFGVQPPLVLSPEEEKRVEEEWKLPPDHQLRIAGGSWGRRRGTSMVVLRQADSRRLVAIFTRHPEVLDPLLTEWIESVTNRPGEATDDQ